MNYYISVVMHCLYSFFHSKSTFIKYYVHKIHMNIGIERRGCNLNSSFAITDADENRSTVQRSINESNKTYTKLIDTKINSIVTQNLKFSDRFWHYEGIALSSFYDS